MSRARNLLVILAFAAPATLCGCDDKEKPVPPAAMKDPAPTATTPEPAPIKSEMTKKGPVGLWFMVRYDGMSHSLEKACWYFSPEAVAYENPKEGLSAADLAAHKGHKGTFTWSPTNMSIAWSDGKKSEGLVELDKDKIHFMWDMGAFNPVAPFADAKLVVGGWEGGQLLFHDSLVDVVRAIVFTSDGKYVYGTLAELSGPNGSVVGEDKESGTWKLDGYTMTLDGKGGKTKRQIAFPFDDDPKKYMYLGGTLYTKQ